MSLCFGFCLLCAISQNKFMTKNTKMNKKSKLWHIHLYMSFFLCNFAAFFTAFNF